jgi:hypothetical protein
MTYKEIIEAQERDMRDPVRVQRFQAATYKEIIEAQERDMRDPVRVQRFQAAWDELIRLEKENGTFSDEFHSRRRLFMEDDLRRGRIRDLSERYVSVRTAILKRQIEVKERAEALQKTRQDERKGA